MLAMEQSLNEQESAVASPGGENFSDVPWLDAISHNMRAVVAVMRELAHSSVPVLLLGEQGTGKRVIARQIHQNSGWPEEHFQVKSCRELNAPELDPSLWPARASLYLSE